MAENKKVTYLVSNGHTLVSNGTATATPLAPGERIQYDEDNAQHKALFQQAEAGDPEANFSIVEVDHKAEAKQQEEQAEMVAKGEEIAAEQRNEELQEEVERVERNRELQEQALEEGQPPINDGTDYPPQDVEAQKLAEQSGPGQRATTQEDVVEEKKATGRKRSSRGG